MSIQSEGAKEMKPQSQSRIRTGSDIGKKFDDLPISNLANSILTPQNHTQPLVMSSTGGSYENKLKSSLESRNAGGEQGGVTKNIIKNKFWSNGG